MDDEKPKLDNEEQDESKKVNIDIKSDDTDEESQKIDVRDDEANESDKTEDSTSASNSDGNESSEPNNELAKEEESSTNELVPPPDDSSEESELKKTEATSDNETPDEEVNDSPENSEGLAPVAQPPADFEQAPSEGEGADDRFHSDIDESQGQSNMSANESQGVPGAVNQAHPHPHRNNKKFALVMVLIIGLMLAGIAVYVYMSTTNNTAEVNSTLKNQAPSAQAESNTKQTTPAATEQDVDITTKAVDDSLKSLDDTSDLAEDQISDKSLGL